MLLRAKYYELVGMSFVFASAGWQVFIERPLSDIRADQRDYHHEQKLDDIWLLLTDLYTHETQERAGFASYTNVKKLNEQWKMAGGGDAGPIEWQVKAASWLTTGIFCLGSAMILWAKWLEVLDMRQPLRGHA